MSLEPKNGGNNSQASWRFEATDDGQLNFQINVSGSVSIDFAKQVLVDAIQRKQKAVSIGDAISLDLLIGGLRKEAINDLGTVLMGAALKDASDE